MVDQQPTVRNDVPPSLIVRSVSKTFVMHMRGGTKLPVISGASFESCPGECVALVGPSGAGKSSLMRMIYGNYHCDSGEILVRHSDGLVDLVRAEPRAVIDIRQRTIGYVSQFLRVIPRVPTLAIVAGSGQEGGLSPTQSVEAAKTLLYRLNIPERLWDLPPATFSGGEQQRVNIARGFIGSHRLLLLDEPTASLDTGNREVVVQLIREKKAHGVAIVGIFHDLQARQQVADREIDLASFSPQMSPEVAA